MAEKKGLTKGGPIERIYALLALLLGLTALLMLLGPWIKINDPIYPNAIVYVDEVSLTYFAPPYILHPDKLYPSDLNTQELKAMTYTEAAAASYQADAECTELGYFRTQYTLMDKIKIFFGFAEPGPSRWNPDGSWNW